MGTGPKARPLAGRDGWVRTGSPGSRGLPEPGVPPGRGLAAPGGCPLGSWEAWQEGGVPILPAREDTACQDTAHLAWTPAVPLSRWASVLFLPCPSTEGSGLQLEVAVLPQVGLSGSPGKEDAPLFGQQEFQAADVPQDQEGPSSPRPPSSGPAAPPWPWAGPAVHSCAGACGQDAELGQAGGRPSPGQGTMVADAPAVQA